MDAIVLAGGMGTRLKKLFPTLPKPLAPIQNVPFLEILLEQLEQSKVVNTVVLSLGYEAEQVQKWLETKSFLFPIEVVIEKKPLGTGGATLYALEKTTTEEVLVMNGDSYLDLCFEKFIEAHYRRRAEVSVAYRYETALARYGGLQIDKKTEKILSFVEKGSLEKGFMNGGIYCFSKKALKKQYKEGFISLEKEILPLFASQGTMVGFYTEGLFIDIGTEESFMQAQTILKPLTKKHL